MFHWSGSLWTTDACEVTDGADVTGVRALSGRPVESLTVEAVRAGEVGVADLRIHPDTLERQAVVAAEHGNPQLAENLRRAAELTRLPDEEVLAVYEALRPGRSSPAQLTALAASLAARDLPRCAALVTRGGGGLRPPRAVWLREGRRMTVIAGIDVGNATTEVVLMSDGKILGAARVPTRGRKGSADSLRGATALVRRVERQLGCTADEARIAPLRAAGTSVVTVPGVITSGGRLRVLAAGVPTPGRPGACVGAPLLLSAAVPPVRRDSAVVAVVPAGLRYDEAATRLRALLADGDRLTLRAACGQLASWPVGMVRAFGASRLLGAIPARSMTCSRWIWLPRPKRPPRARAAPARRSWSRR
jgi:propanediol dehydratase small subunit